MMQIRGSTVAADGTFAWFVVLCEDSTNNRLPHQKPGSSRAGDLRGAVPSPRVGELGPRALVPPLARLACVRGEWRAIADDPAGRPASASHRPLTVASDSSDNSPWVLRRPGDGRSTDEIRSARTTVSWCRSGRRFGPPEASLTVTVGDGLDRPECFDVVTSTCDACRSKIKSCVAAAPSTGVCRRGLDGSRRRAIWIVHSRRLRSWLRLPPISSGARQPLGMLPN